MKKILLTFFTLICTFTYAQKKYANEKLGFTIIQPEDWITVDTETSIKNVKNLISFDSETIENLIKSHNGSIEIINLVKYPIKSRSGIIPSIKINLRNNSYKNLDDFKLGITKSFNGLMEVFPDFKFEITPKTIEINGKKTILAKGTYTLELPSGKEKVKL